MKRSYLAVRLETERLIIRAWSLDDIEAAFALYSDPVVLEFLCMDGVVTREQMTERLRTLCAQREVLADGMGSFAMERKDGGEVIGAILMKQLPRNGEAAAWSAWDYENDPTGHPPLGKIEIGWHQRPEFWGHGYVTEAAREMMRYGFEDLGLSEIWCVLNAKNVRSANVALRLRMCALGVTSDYYDQDLDTYCQTKNDWARYSMESTGPKAT